MDYFSIPIDRVVKLLGLEEDPRTAGRGAASYNVRCPFCGGKKYKMNINVEKNAFHCMKCGAGGGALKLFAEIQLGIELVPGKKDRGGNGSYVYAKLCEALGMSSRSAHTDKPPAIQPRRQEIKAADDKMLHEAYTAVLQFPYLALTDEHKANLLRRGITEKEIEKNRYRSAVDFSWVHQYTKIKDFYFKQLHSQFEKNPTLNRLPVSQRIGGIIIASVLQKRGISIKNIPGFFTLTAKTQAGEDRKFWCFRLESGMYIPTRNENGLVVSLQVRRDSGNLRYITLSSKGLNDGVQTGIARAHYPKGNASLSDPNTAVLLTEGPLKADVALSLLKQQGKTNIYFVAIPGVNNTAQIETALQHLQAVGVTKLYNALDMDRVTNPHVMAASRNLREVTKRHGLQLVNLMWDLESLPLVEAYFTTLCRENKISVPASDNAVTRICNMVQNLHQKGILFEREWKGSGKGIDDYLLSCRI